MKYFVAILFWLLLATSPAFAVTVYVKASCTNNITTYSPGADTCTGGADRVFSGIQNAHDWASLAAGDIIDVRAGTYSENLSLTKSGSVGNPITLRAHVGETVTTGALGFIWEPVVSYWTVDGFTFDGNLTGPRLEFNAGFTGQMTNVTIRNSTFQDGGRHCLFGFGSFNLFQDITIQNCGLAEVSHDDYGFYFSGSDTIFERINMHDVRGYGFHIFDSGSNAVARNIVRDSILGPNIATGSPEGGFAVIVSTGPDNQVYRNVIYSNNGGVQADYRCHGCKIYNNTIYSNTTAGIQVGANNDSTGIVIKNNIIRSNGSNGISNLGGSGHILSNNHCDSAGTGCSTTGDPLFVNAAGADFALTATSPALNAGTTAIASGVTVPANCTANPDIGAFQTFCIGSAEVGLVADDVIDLAATLNDAQPLLPAATITGFTTTCGTIASAARTGNTHIYLTLTAPATTPCTYSYSTGTGNVTNSALIGSTLNQRLNAITTVSVTDNTAAGGPTLAYVAGRFYLLQGATDTAWVPLAAADTNITIPPGAKLNWRLKIANTGDEVNVAPRIRISYDGGGYVELTNSFVNAIRMLGTGAQLGTVMTESSSITQDQLTSTHGNVACTYTRSAVAQPTLTLTTNSESECAVAIEFDSTAVAAKVYNFKVYTDAGVEIGGPMAVTIGNYIGFR